MKKKYQFKTPFKDGISRLVELKQPVSRNMILLYDYPKYAIVIGPTRVT